MRTERVVLETDRHRIIGNLTLPREGYRSRLSDFLNRGDVEFIPLTDVELGPLEGNNGSSIQRRTFLAVARGHIQLAHPFDDGA